MRVVLVEKHPVTSLGIEVAIGAEDDMKVVGTSDSAEETLKLAKELRPDLIVINLLLKSGNSSIGLCEKIKLLPVPPYILLYTDRNSTEDLVACRSSKADGYVHKSEDRRNLIKAIQTVCIGKQHWLVGDAPEHPGTQGTQLGEVIDCCGILTPREQEVLKLLSTRRTNAEIAEKLSISCETAKFHTKNVLSKLELKSRRDVS